MPNYALAYRLGITPWDRYGPAVAASIGALLDREETERSRSLGRALDLGCGHGYYTHELARRGWDALGIDNVPRAIEAATRRLDSGARFVVGDVTNLMAARLGTFDFFLMLAFQPTRMRSVVGGVSQAEIQAAFAGWDMLVVEPAQRAGLGWPLTKTAPQWYRLQRSV